MKQMNIAIIGTGYVGLTTGVCLAEIGHQVMCVDNVTEKIDQLKKNISPIYEPGIEELIKSNAENGRLEFTSDLASAVTQAEVIFICVNTPPKPDGQADLRYVEAVAREISEHLNGAYKVIVDKSTVPVKTAEKVKRTIQNYNKNAKNFDVVSNPEFLREGRAVQDTLHPDRLVIGVDSDKAKQIMLDVYKPITDADNTPVKVVSIRSAELIKHGANTFLATKISYANMIAEICEAAGADALEVLEAIGLDERIGSQFLSPGIGFGGSCFPKDISAFKMTALEYGVNPALIDAVEAINANAWSRFVEKIEKHWMGGVEGKKIAILGLAFKPDTDDIRNAPALKIIEQLHKAGAVLTLYDPQAMDNVKKVYPDLAYFSDPYQAVKDCEAVVICTEWEEFKKLNLAKVKAAMHTPVIFDGRNVLDSQAAKTAGFKYFGIGK